MVEVQNAPSILSQSSEVGVILEIETNVLNAVNVLLNRVLSGGAEPRVEDRKSDSTANCVGTVQDCEFGLMVLSSRAWLKQQEKLEGRLANEREVKDLLIRLLRKTVEAISIKSSESTKSIQAKGTQYTGGELDDSPIWFRGDPYTNVPDRKQIYCSANLDSAMLILAFLASALVTYHDELLSAEAPASLQGVGARTLRDATLLVCKEALRYAVQCRVEENGEFQGFTCDPGSNVPSASGPTASLIPEEDRLFFSWTTCETLHELLEQSDWKEYLDSIESTVAVPGLVAEMRSLLTRLGEDLGLASRWCCKTFLHRFRELDPPQIASVVSAFGPLGNTGLPDASLRKRCAEVSEYVRNVYSISQYAAIRSISPSGTMPITISEVKDIATILKNMVTESILQGGLDKAGHFELYQTLTRYYNPGLSSPKEYEDDAYFPLVVRSLAGLLTRTITYLKSTERRERILVLVAEYKGYLRDLYKEMTTRRPQDAEAEPDDENLWSVARERPFVLYATQRTVFALLAYKDFLEAMAKFEEGDGEPEPKTPAEEMRDLLARSLADTLIKPVLDKFLASAALLKQGIPALTPSPAGYGQLTLPEPKWVWLSGFTAEFGKQNIPEKLSQLATKLNLGRNTLRSKRRPSKAGGQIEKAYKGLKETIEIIFNFPEVGTKLRTLDEEEGSWNAEALFPILFEQIFREAAKNGSSLAELATVEGNDLWNQVEVAHGFVKMISASATN